MSVSVSSSGPESHGAQWWNGFWSKSEQHFGPPREELIDLVLEKHAAHSNDQPFRVIDVGSGNGRYAIPFAQYGLSTTALERSDSGCRVIEQRAGTEGGVDNLQVVQGDVLTIAKDHRLPHGSFDVVFSSGLLEEIPKEAQGLAVANMANLVRKGGLFILKYCLEISERGVTVAEGSVPPMFTEGDQWNVHRIETDSGIRDSIAPITFENLVRTETVIATRM